MRNEKIIKILAPLLLAIAFSSEALYQEESALFDFIGNLIFNFLFIFAIWSLIKYLKWTKAWSTTYSFGIPFIVSFLPELLSFMFAPFSREKLLELLTSSVPSVIVVVGGINLYYQYLLTTKPDEIPINIEPEDVLRCLFVNSARGKSRIELNRLLLVHYAVGKTYLYLSDDQQIISFDSLSSIAQKLADAPHFFQLNRSAIVGHSAIHRYQTQSDGRVKVLVLDKDFLVSKNKAFKFKQWFEGQA